MTLGVGLFVEANASAGAEASVLGRGASVDAVRGVMIWQQQVRGIPVLMRRVDGRTSRVPGMRPVRPDSGFRSLDLGEDEKGRIVAVYILNCQLRRRCEGPYVADIRAGGERRLALPKHRGCATVKSVSVWRDQIAYALRCPAAGRSGVYVARNGRTRLVIPQTSGAAGEASLADLGPGFVAAVSDGLGLQIGSTDAPRCRATVVAGGGDDLGPVAVTRGRITWVREVRGDFGGVQTTLERRAIAPNCTPTPLGLPRELNALVGDEAFVDGFAIVGKTLYVSADGTIFTTSLVAGSTHSRAVAGASRGWAWASR